MAFDVVRFKKEINLLERIAALRAAESAFELFTDSNEKTFVPNEIYYITQLCEDVQLAENLLNILPEGPDVTLMTWDFRSKNFLPEVY